MRLICNWRSLSYRLPPFLFSSSQARAEADARLLSTHGLTVLGGAQRWVGVDWVCSATAHGTADNITGLTHLHLYLPLHTTRAHTSTHTHTCTSNWRAASNYTLNLIRAYVYGSEHMWPPRFLCSIVSLPLCLPICLSKYHSVWPKMSPFLNTCQCWCIFFFHCWNLYKLTEKSSFFLFSKNYICRLNVLHRLLKISLKVGQDIKSLQSFLVILY